MKQSGITKSLRNRQTNQALALKLAFRESRLRELRETGAPKATLIPELQLVLECRKEFKQAPGAWLYVPAARQWVRAIVTRQRFLENETILGQLYLGVEKLDLLSLFSSPSS